MTLKQMVNKEKTLKELSVTELESLAYRQIVAGETAQANLKIINQELQTRNKPEVVAEPEKDAE